MWMVVPNQPNPGGRLERDGGICASPRGGRPEGPGYRPPPVTVEGERVRPHLPPGMGGVVWPECYAVPESWRCGRFCVHSEVSVKRPPVNELICRR